MTLPSGRPLLRYLAAIAVVAVTTLSLSPFSFSLSGRGVAVASVLLLGVVLTAIQWGVGPGLLAAVASTICLDVFFYSGPLSVTLDEGVGFVCFLLSSVLVGRLSSRARRTQQEATNLRVAFDQASELEAAKRNEQFKSVLLDTVTHDFRTPLTSIKAAASTLVQESKEDPAGVTNVSERLLQTIVQESDRLDQFIQGMIEMAKAESSVGRSEQGDQSAPLEDIFAAALSRAEGLLQRHQVAVNCDDDLYVRANPRAIAQVLFSLLENAARYSSPGTTISIAAASRDCEFIDVAVEDEGSGVPHSLREKIFEKFIRGRTQAPVAEGHAGLGIGLAIARGIVTANGGAIRAEDRLDGRRGARFVFTVPAGPQQTELAAEGAAGTL